MTNPAGLRQTERTKIVQQIEKDFQQAIVDLAKLCGWLVYHTHDSRRSEPGFPDLVLVRERVLFWEVKTEKGRISEPQAKWLDRLAAAGAEAQVVRPTDWKWIEETLKRRTPEAPWWSKP